MSRARGPSSEDSIEPDRTVHDRLPHVPDAGDGLTSGAIGAAISALATSAVTFGALSARRLDWCHVDALADVEGLLPPILVHAPTMEVIDGSHRLAVARRLGRPTIAAELFDGTYEEALVEAVTRNSAHGKPLTRTDRRRAAERLLALAPYRSDRAFAVDCGIAPATVAAIRKRTTVQIEQLISRVGRDGKLRALPRVKNPSKLVQLQDAFLTGPTDGLPKRAIGPGVQHPQEAKRLDNTDAVPRPDEAPVASVPAHRQELDESWWASDPALAARCCSLVALLEASTVMSDDLIAAASDIPLSRRYLLADEARRRSRLWMTIASAFERPRNS